MQRLRTGHHQAAIGPQHPTGGLRHLSRPVGHLTWRRRLENQHFRLGQDASPRRCASYITRLRCRQLGWMCKESREASRVQHIRVPIGSGSRSRAGLPASLQRRVHTTVRPGPRARSGALGLLDRVGVQGGEGSAREGAWGPATAAGGLRHLAGLLAPLGSVWTEIGCDSR